MMKYFLRILFISYSSVALGQFTVSEDTLRNTNILTTSLLNDVTNSSLNSRLQYKSDFGNYTLTILNNFSSDVTKLNTNFIRDYEQLDFSLRYKISNILSIGPGAGLKSLSDDRNVELNKNFTGFLYSDILYEPVQSLRINSKFGYMRDEQIGELNSGLKALTNIEYPNLMFDGYFSSSLINLNYEDLSEKQNYNFEIISDLFKNFSQFADNLGSVRAFTNKVDLYFPASQDVQQSFGIRNNIESRMESQLQLEDRLRYFLSNELLMNIHGGLLTRVTNREIRYKTFTNTLNFDRNYDASVEELALRFSGEIEHSTSKFLNKIRLQFFERNETHSPKNLAGFTQNQIREIESIERNKNYSNAITTLSGESIFRLSDLHALSLTGSASILRYDTNSDENFDDRDEQYLIAEMKHSFSNLRNFIIETTFSVNRASLKYLFRERSSNNNVNTIYKLSVRNVFKPFEAITNIGSFQVSANYTVYDFEDILSQVQSFSYRQLTLRDSLEYTISPRVFIRAFGEYKLSEQGEFNDSEFSLRPLTLFDDRFIKTDINLRMFEFAEIYLGYRFYQQMRFNYLLGEKNLANTFRNYGPIGGLKVNAVGRTFINFQGGVEILRFDNSNQNTTSSFFSINIFWDI